MLTAARRSGSCYSHHQERRCEFPGVSHTLKGRDEIPANSSLKLSHSWMEPIGDHAPVQKLLWWKMCSKWLAISSCHSYGLQIPKTSLQRFLFPRAGQTSGNANVTILVVIDLFLSVRQAWRAALLRPGLSHEDSRPKGEWSPFCFSLEDF